MIENSSRSYHKRYWYSNHPTHLRWSSCGQVCVYERIKRRSVSLDSYISFIHRKYIYFSSFNFHNIIKIVMHVCAHNFLWHVPRLSTLLFKNVGRCEEWLPSVGWSIELHLCIFAAHFIWHCCQCKIYKGIAVLQKKKKVKYVHSLHWCPLYLVCN